MLKIVLEVIDSKIDVVDHTAYIDDDKDYFNGYLEALEEMREVVNKLIDIEM